MSTKALIIGLDGAEWTLVEHFQKEGRLPNLRKLMSEGAHGPLNSTTPPMTLPSWSSMLSGCHPGTHGIFDFVHRDSRGHDWNLEFTNATHRAVPTIHEWLSMCGHKVASIAVPTTWPPAVVNGVMVSGFDSPVSTGIDGSFCHPPELYDELVAKFGGLSFADFQESAVGEGWLEQARELLLSEIGRKEAIGEWLLNREAWSCFMLLFGESDTASHHFWRFFDVNSPRYEEQASEDIRHTIRDVYERLDQAVGKLIETANAEVVCICSDHGFGGAGDIALFLNNFLESKGWLHTKTDRHQSQGRLLDWVRRVGLSRIPSRYQGRLFRALPTGWKNRLEGQSRFGNIDFSKTIALSDEMNYAATIRLNTADKGMAEEREIIERLTKDLLSWRVDGQAPVSKVEHRDSLYSGSQVHRSPELILTLNLRDGYTYTLLPSVRVDKGVTWKRLDPSEFQGGKGLGMNGSHRQHGVILLSGDNVIPKRIYADMADIAPTILQAIGAVIPSYMEGKVLDIFQESLPKRMVEYEPSKGSTTANSAKEHNAIRRRLEQLGYL